MPAITVMQRIVLPEFAGVPELLVFGNDQFAIVGIVRGNLSEQFLFELKPLSGLKLRIFLQSFLI
ncbi:MAG: hypothetical protein SFX18_02495 [Pirellulales bacterium]|nr:hypothetical protein [Pirellulales bacterium]